MKKLRLAFALFILLMLTSGSVNAPGGYDAPADTRRWVAD